MLYLLKITFLLLFAALYTIPAAALEEGLFAKMNTNRGTILLRLHYQSVPQTVANFVGLVEGTKSWKDPITGKWGKSRFYNGLTFHRVIKDFMIQGGDPNTKPEPGNTSDKWGIGGPGYSIDAEFNGIKHDRGIVSMARSNDPNSAGSQFFIVHKDSPHLDEKYTVFGRIITAESYETLDKIANLEVNSRSQPFDNSLSAAILLDVDIVKRSTIENVLTMDPPERILNFIPAVDPK